MTSSHFWSHDWSVRQFGRSVWQKTLNILFPRVCYCCNTAVQSEGLCSVCWQQLVFLRPPYCMLCGQPGALQGPETRRLCHHCSASIPYYNQHRALWEYGVVTRRLIMAFKHGRQRHLGAWLAQCMAPIIDTQPIDMIVPVPLHPHRLAQRGFNQAALLAKSLGELTGIPVRFNALIRTTPTLSQHGFSSQQRWDNVQHAFKAFPCVNSKNILLVDDVCTTGATLNASAIALREQQAQRIDAITIAKVVM